uniref:G_PROTEIN_RECEP_F1_2 domain-containing protein n=1 Tax=Macrostomum lignano TaxID=282301 RepID=A0A1I8FNB8_9PLAT
MSFSLACGQCHRGSQRRRRQLLNSSSSSSRNYCGLNWRRGKPRSLVLALLMAASCCNQCAAHNCAAVQPAPFAGAPCTAVLCSVCVVNGLDTLLAELPPWPWVASITNGWPHPDWACRYERLRRVHGGITCGYSACCCSPPTGCGPCGDLDSYRRRFRVAPPWRRLLHLGRCHGAGPAASAAAPLAVPSSYGPARFVCGSAAAAPPAYVLACLCLGFLLPFATLCLLYVAIVAIGPRRAKRRVGHADLHWLHARRGCPRLRPGRTLNLAKMTGALLAAWILLAGPSTPWPFSIDRSRTPLELRDSLNRLRESADRGGRDRPVLAAGGLRPACPCLVLAVRPTCAAEAQPAGQLQDAKVQQSRDGRNPGCCMVTRSCRLERRSDAASATLPDAGGAEADLQITDAGSEWEPAAETALAEPGEPLASPTPHSSDQPFACDVRGRSRPAFASAASAPSLAGAALGDISGDEEAKEAASSAAAVRHRHQTDPELATKDAEPQQGAGGAAEAKAKKKQQRQERGCGGREQKKKKKKKAAAAPVEPTAPGSGLQLQQPDASASAKRRPRRVRQNSVEAGRPWPQAQQQSQPLPPCITKSPVRPKRRPRPAARSRRRPLSATPREEATELAEIRARQRRPAAAGVDRCAEEEEAEATASRTLRANAAASANTGAFVSRGTHDQGRCFPLGVIARRFKRERVAKEKKIERKSRRLRQKKAERKKQKTEAEEKLDDDDSESDEDKEADAEEEDEDSSGGDDDDEAEDTGPEELEWFSLEGCDPEPSDAAAVARLIRRCQLPPWAPAGAAAALAERLTDTPEGPPEEKEADGEDAEDDGVLSLLVKARAEELPPELSLPQLEALQTELAQAKSAPSRLLLISPACVAGEAPGAEEAVFAEDDILQAAAGLGAWKPLRPPAGRGEADGQSWIYRVCLLDANRLSAAIDRLRQTPSQQFALVLQLPWDSAMCQDSSDLITNSSGAAADATGYRMEAANAALCVFNALANGLSMAVFLNRSFARSPACLLLTGLSLFETIFQLCQALYLAVGLSLVRSHLPLPGPGLPLLLAGLAAAARQLARNWTLAGLSFHRFEAVCRHGVGRKLLAKSRCIPALAVCGIACAAVALPRLFEMFSAEEGPGVGVPVAWLSTPLRPFRGPVPFGPVFHSRLYQLLYLSACLFLLQSGGPSLVVTVCSARVLRVLWERRRFRESRNLRRRPMPAFFSKLLFAFRALPAEAELLGGCCVVEGLQPRTGGEQPETAAGLFLENGTISKRVAVRTDTKV